MQNSLPAIEVTAGLIWRDGALLVAQRPPQGRCANLWEFPGGKLEAGESAEVALCREVREELGIDVVVGPLAWAVRHTSSGDPVSAPPNSDDRVLSLRFFHACQVGDAPAQALCSQRIAWLAPAALIGLPFCPADRPLIDMLANGFILPWDGRHLEAPATNAGS